MKRSFVEDLEQFAYSVDILTDITRQRLDSLLKRYFEQSLQADFYEVLVAGPKTRNNNPTLTTLWSNRKPYTMHVFENDAYTGQTAYAFDKEKPLWITNTTKGSLASGTDYVDAWSNVTDLPSYWDPENITAATSIIIPLVSPPIGFMTLEFKRYTEYTENARRELSRLANALGIILSLHKAYELQNNNTGSAIDGLAVRLSQERTSPLIKPRVFVAFSGRADNGAVGIIKDVLNSFSADLDIVSWDDMSQSGDINQQILETISTATYGVCYFSEPNDSQSQFGDYMDNSNVVFEAGMLQAHVNSLTKKPTAWIPIREGNSPTTPFDFATQRMIVIKRDHNGKINKQEFHDKLERQIKEWFSN